MARSINKLSAVEVAKKAKPGTYGDGGGLYLQVAKSTAKGAQEGAITKSWLFRFMLAGKARYMGLGDVQTFNLKEARERARAARQLVSDGKDPIEDRRERTAALRADDAKRITFKQASERYIAAQKAGWKNAKHADQWQNTLATYAFPVIGDLPVAKVDTAHVMQILEPIWTTKTETATRVRGRVELVLDWAKARHYRGGDNPARWRGHLDKLLPARSKVAKVEHHAAMPYADLPAFMAQLRSMDSISARALEFTILTAVRTGEAIGVMEGEVDFANKLWTIPAVRMKADRPHRVPLSDRAIEILKGVPREAESPYLFPGARKGKPLSNMAMLELLRGMEGMEGLTVHGFRSTFRDWAAERSNFPREIAEAALAHVLTDKTEAAYQRGDMLEKRRRLMTAWAGYCNSGKTA
ncbi:integrase arm-type DNA-binding domain-containing protein [Mesorhizobium sp. C416B]|uniref:tyrosine-type recombinase/integrase n=1 Tax=unclassified Mesorhizobium TaxID=325217 RepID=UPI0003CED0B1|nr:MULTISPECIES: site-specific integrase [unclassified Mesorhizobium]ESX48810.1 integrase [Mesorhizobium sp. LSHC426A00]ESX55558.1 integrase [Mesorhizobium sp. LSHC424B00]ESX70287.1 integrase [Mesorhizobium sp. LSHC416B00]WJI61667.1 integrase arm-type DNA-binding domain-containing protein [Mesorhizobium sp. C416B]